ncbi:Uncharacterized protein APZ42_025016 [Daphnia magna]|uniref:Uncharacterized protein n=1 Tax=Daphnia magna TaxID=35525 RepID=A0A164TJJ7_9CRUS|nr:Uncharacterized protein APZ42_025016 [Daphnia magna]
MPNSCVESETHTIVCVLHVDEKVNQTEKIILLKESTLAKCKEAEIVYRFRFNSKFAKIKLPTCFSNTVGYHVKCYSNYISVKQEQIQLAKQNAIELQNESEVNHSAEPASPSIDCGNTDYGKTAKIKCKPNMLNIVAGEKGYWLSLRRYESSAPWKKLRSW